LSSYDLERDQSKPGEALRSQAANFLAERYGPAKIETRRHGKKVDIIFEYEDYGRPRRLYVEAKDHSHPLSRDTVAHIWADYSGIINRAQAADLLIVTRFGLTPDADKFVNTEQTALRHRTIWELENEIFQITPYLRTLAALFAEDGLSEYYVEARARKEESEQNSEPLLPVVRRWIYQDGLRPLAILGGYGAGKTSFARRFVSDQAQRALSNPYERRPLLISLGDLSQASNLKALLGMIFTADFPIKGYSFSRFIQLNRSGRFVIVLDGFDEMKHAMTWADFRATVRDLNLLVDGSSKVILLGRPSAFLSDLEHKFVLRGMRLEDNVQRREIDWPEYDEYALDDFREEECQTFVTHYLGFVARRNARLSSQDHDPDWLRARAQELRELVHIEQNVLSRPIHARILVELAADRATDLTIFRRGVSRYRLYQTFLRRLAEKETEKIARRPISAEDRLLFLRRIAFWLWTRGTTTTDFQATEVPSQIMRDLPDGDSVSDDSKLREYLSGAFLDQKRGNLFFPHRSFAEFLVAEYMLANLPQGNDHQVYSNILNESIGQFLKESSSPDLVHWIRTLANTRCQIDTSYITFLANIPFYESPDRNRTLSRSFWRPAFAALSNSLSRGAKLDVLLEGMFGSDIPTMAMSLLVWVRLWLPNCEFEKDRRASTSRVVAALIARFLSMAGHAADFTSHAARGEVVELVRDILSTSIVHLVDDERIESILEFQNIEMTVSRALSAMGIRLDFPEISFTDTAAQGPITLSYPRILKHVPADMKSKARELLLRGDLSRRRRVKGLRRQ
jgi:NACHT domain